MREAGPFPGLGRDEKETLSGFLDWYRDVVVRKVEDLDQEAATRRLVPSYTSPFGIVKHLAYVERGWFQRRFLGSDAFRMPVSERIAFEFTAAPGETVAGVLDFYKEECAKSREIVASHSLGEESVQPDAEHQTLRWIVLHMIEETARHAGQLDILRELIDGTTGE